MKKDLTTRLSNLNFPEIGMKSHKLALRNRLLESKYFDVKNKISFSESIFNFITNLKNLFYMKKAIFLPAALILILMASFVFNYKTDPNALRAQAQEIIKESQNEVEKLNPEEEKQLQQKFQDNINQMLEEAYKAEDLIIIHRLDDKNEPNINIFEFTTGPNNKDEIQSINLNDTDLNSIEDSTVFKFTDSKDRKITLILDKNNIPVMMSALVLEDNDPEHPDVYFNNTNPDSSSEEKITGNEDEAFVKDSEDGNTVEGTVNFEAAIESEDKNDTENHEDADENKDGDDYQQDGADYQKDRANYEDGDENKDGENYQKDGEDYQKDGANYQEEPRN